MISNREVAENVKVNVERLLGDRNWSQRRLSRETGDPHMSIVNSLSGEHVPNSAILARIAEALGVKVDALLAAAPKPKRKSRRSA